jgi:hypothetical protein
MLFLGGYSSVTLPSAYFSNDQDAEWNRLAFAYNYPALDLYSNFSGVTATGAGTETLVSGGVQIDNLRNFTSTPTMTGIATSEIIDKGLVSPK